MSSYRNSFDALQKFLGERVFLKQNIESEGLGAVTFLVDGARFCTEPATGRLDFTCQKAIDDAKVRVIVSGDPNAVLTMRFELGAKRRSPLSLIIEKDRALQLDVRGSEYAQLVKDAALPASLSQYLVSAQGDTSVRLEKLGPKSFALSMSVTSDFQAEVVSPDGTRRSYFVGARTPAWRVAVDGVKGTHSVKFDVSKVVYDMPYGDVSGHSGDQTRTILTIDGLGFEATTDAAPALAKGSVRLGNASSLTYGGAEVVGVTTSGPLNFTLAQDTDSTLKLDVNDLDATLRLHLALVPGASQDPATSDETYRLRLTGGAPSLKLGVSGHKVGLKVAKGTLSISAQKAGASVDVPAGACLMTPESPNENATPLLKALTTMACQ